MIVNDNIMMLVFGSFFVCGFDLLCFDLILI